MLETPDLSQSFHPQPKVYKSKKTPMPLKKIGKKTEDWEVARKELKKLFEVNGVVSCQLKYKGCWGKNALTFAHFAKRRKLSPSDLMEVALLCTPCHEQVERLPAKKMEKIIKDLIKARGW